MSGFSNEVFQRHIDTDHLSIDEVVETIGALADVKLLPDNRSNSRKKFDRLKPSLRTFGFSGNQRVVIDQTIRKEGDFSS